MMNNACMNLFEWKGMKVNVSMTIRFVVMIERYENITDCEITIGGERLKQVKVLVYLRVY